MRRHPYMNRRGSLRDRPVPPPFLFNYPLLFVFFSLRPRLNNFVLPPGIYFGWRRPKFLPHHRQTLITSCPFGDKRGPRAVDPMI